MDFINTFDMLSEAITEAETELTPENAKQELEQVKAKLKQQRAERKELLAKLKGLNRDSFEYNQLDAELNASYDESKPLITRAKELDDYLYSLKTNVIADDDDWDRFFMSDTFPAELEYDDLGVEVTGEFGGNPIPDNMPMWWPISYEDEYTMDGVIDRYTYSLDSRSDWDDLEVWKGVMAKYLNKPLDEITKEELFKVDKGSLEEWLKEYFFDDAKEHVEELWDAGDIDYNRVRWYED